MSKNEKQWPDWSDFMKTGKAQNEHPLSKALNNEPNKGGEKVTKEQLAKEATDIVRAAHSDPRIRQATDQELFGHLVVSEEELNKRNEEWQNKIANFFKEVKKPLDKTDIKEWANGKSYNDTLSEEELTKRNMSVDDDSNAGEE